MMPVFRIFLITAWFLTAGSIASASPNPNAVAIDSPLARSTAVTTTETKPYVASVEHPTGFTLLYSGSRGSKIEPCGCRALNLGGIDKEAAMVEAVRKATSATLMVDAGGFYREFTEANTKLQTWYLLEALSALKCEAINVGYTDLREGLASLLKLQKEKNLPFISANIVDAKTNKPWFPASKSFTRITASGAKVRITVVGVSAANFDQSRPMGGGAPLQQPQAAQTSGTASIGTDIRSRWIISDPHSGPVASEAGGAGEGPSSGGSSPALEYATASTTGVAVSQYAFLDEIEVLRPLTEKLRSECEVLVLLSFAGPDRSRRIAEALPAFDIVIAGDYVRRVEATPMGNRPTLFLAPDHEGKYLGQVDMAFSADAKLTSTSAVLHPILQSFTPLPQFTVFLESYKRDTASLPVPVTQQIAGKVYAGATSCRMCHAEAFTQWKTHHHSRAMKALVDKQMHYNTDCLKCHTVAFKQPGGFTDLRVTPNLANVQCEVCHGAGQKHVEEQQKLAQLTAAHQPLPARTAKLKMEWDSNFCMQCHDPQNDPNFNFAEDIQRVRHKNPAAPRVRSTTASLTM